MRTTDVSQRVEEAAATSALLQAVALVRSDGGVRFALGTASVRPLTPTEIAELERLGNSSSDWSRVRVAEGFDPRTVRHSCFTGNVVLGTFTRNALLSDSVELPSGILRSTIVDSTVGSHALVQDVRLLANYVIGPSAVLMDCGSVLCEGRTSFGNGAELKVGIETGGREVAVFAEIDPDTAARVARLRAHPDELDAYRTAVAAYANQARSARGIVAAHAVIRDTPQVRNSYVGCHARVDGATLVDNSTLLSTADEPAVVASGACVTNSILQWGCRASTLAIVDRSVMMEHSSAERHANIAHCIVGPNSGIGAGEAIACLLGPFVGFHHQALLIAVYWPEGKGNVGYGANVGSNHTGKVPDQEFWPGEGLFLGLGVNIRYPADFSKAPYSIIASGVSTLPQRVTFPFSLINVPSKVIEGISPAFNEIIPAWMLTDNIFGLKRNEAKYRARNAARRTEFEFAIFRPETVTLMLHACRRLEAVETVKDVYTERDIPGLGKNYLLESSRRQAIEAYRFYIRYFALLGLMTRARQLADVGKWELVDHLLDSPTGSFPWEFQRVLLRKECGVTNVPAALQELAGMLVRVARDVEESKTKDDRRGSRIIEDYGQAHVSAAEDPLVHETWRETHQLIRTLNELVAALHQHTTVAAQGSGVQTFNYRQ